jgi:hypothetical protein
MKYDRGEFFFIWGIWPIDFILTLKAFFIAVTLTIILPIVFSDGMLEFLKDHANKSIYYAARSFVRDSEDLYSIILTLPIVINQLAFTRAFVNGIRSGCLSRGFVDMAVLRIFGLGFLLLGWPTAFSFHFVEEALPSLVEISLGVIPFFLLANFCRALRWVGLLVGMGDSLVYLLRL